MARRLVREVLDYPRMCIERDTATGAVRHEDESGCRSNRIARVDVLAEPSTGTSSQNSGSVHME